MTAPRPRRGFGIVAKLMLLSLGLLAIPWLAGRYLEELEDFALEGQRSALQLAARAVATVLQGREALFGASGGLPFGPWEGSDCSPLPLGGPVQLDGNGRDWNLAADDDCRFGGVSALAGAPAPAAEDLAFELALGQRGGQLHALVEVTDDRVLFRHPRHRNLDGADHLRLSVPDGAGGEARYLATAESDGPITVYPVDADFRYAQGDGLPEPRVRGHWRRTGDGYTVEMRLPLDFLPEKRIGLAVADVDARPGPVRHVLAATPPDDAAAIRLVLLDSREIRELMQEQVASLPGARITVVDRQRRVRSEVGNAGAAVEAPERTRLLDEALAPHSQQARAAAAGRGPYSGARVTAAAAPIRAGDRVLGAVLIEQSNLEILGLQRAALERALSAILVVCVGVAGLLGLFAWRLAWRIHRLRDEAGAAIDADGRVRRSAVDAGSGDRDEIGDLSRTVTGLLTRLARYTAFLEQIPRTLRHELSNPLNSVSTSLENLVAEEPALEKSKYLRSAERGVARLGEIVESLTDAASLGQALRDDEPERVDLALLLERYVDNLRVGCRDRRFRLEIGPGPIPVLASGFRLEQLLDKLVDNAVAFSPVGGEIALSLRARGGEAVLAVSNDGRSIPEELRERIFDSMVSTRAGGSGDEPHLGIGLFVVRSILDHLGGRIAVADREGGEGAVFEVRLPLAGGDPASG